MRFLILISALSAASAAADEKNGLPLRFCQPAKAIAPPSEYCEDNTVFTREAERCLANLRSEVKQEGERVKALFSRTAGAGQKTDFNSSAYDHKQASRRLFRMIQLAKVAAIDIDSYLDAVYFPIDYEMPTVNGGDPKGYVMKQPCYRDTVEAIDSILVDIRQIARELWVAKLQADRHGTTLGSRETNIDAATANRAIASKPGQGAPGSVPLQRGKQGTRPSTITGKIKKPVDTKMLNKPKK